LGYSTEELLNFFYSTETLIMVGKGKYQKIIDFDLLSGQRATRDVKHPENKFILVKKNRKFTRLAVKKMKEAGLTTLPVTEEEVATLFAKRHR
jgi:DNA-directed RNA polymerase subunit beta